MRLAKLFTVLNGLFYAGFGLYWAFMPRRLANLFGWEAKSTLGLHELRAYGMFFFAFGMIILSVAMRRLDQRPLILALLFVTMSFFVGRCLGLLLDGTGPMLTYYEMGLEVFTIAFGLLAYRMSAPKTLT